MNEVLKSPKNLSDCRLWIGNLDSKLREFNLLKMVEKFGPLVEFDFLYHRSGLQNGQPRGYAFITYKSLESARKAQRTLDGLEVMGRKIVVKWAHAPDESKFVGKVKPAPAILSITTKEAPDNDSVKKLSKESKIAALEAQLKLIEEKSGEVSLTPDFGGSSKPTSVTYNYIDNKPKTVGPYRPSTSHAKHNHRSSNPYLKKGRRK